MYPEKAAVWKLKDKVFIALLVELFQRQRQRSIGITARRRIFEMPCQQGKQLAWKNLRPDVWHHKLPENMFPFFPMRLYIAAVFLKGNKVRYLVDQRNQEAVFVQVGVNGYFVPATHAAVIAMAGHALVDDFKMNMIGNNQLKNRLH